MCQSRRDVGTAFGSALRLSPRDAVHEESGLDPTNYGSVTAPVSAP